MELPGVSVSATSTDQPEHKPELTLRCINCDYDLTGSRQSARCPECGGALDWDAIRAHALDTPKLAFERLSGPAKLRGFARTALDVLILPHRLAARAGQRIRVLASLRFALWMLITALAVGTARIAYERPNWDWYDFGEVALAWAVAVPATLISLAGLAIVFATLELASGCGWFASWRFWFATCCYTTFHLFVATALLPLPPLILLPEVVEALQGGSMWIIISTTFMFDDYYYIPTALLVHWAVIHRVILTVRWTPRRDEPALRRVLIFTGGSGMFLVLLSLAQSYPFYYSIMASLWLLG